MRNSTIGCLRGGLLLVALLLEPGAHGLGAWSSARAQETVRPEVGKPLLAAMKAEPQLAEQLERGGLRLRRRSALAAAARQVLALLAVQHGRVA